MTDQETYDELSFYTLSLRDPSFPHQLIVDAYAAQHADQNTKPINIAFSLAGLYLHNVRGFTGREVQLAHMRLAKNKKSIPTFKLPVFRGEIKVGGVLKAQPGPARDDAIERWSASTWKAFSSLECELTAWLDNELS